MSSILLTDVIIWFTNANYIVYRGQLYCLQTYLLDVVTCFQLIFQPDIFFKF